MEELDLEIEELLRKAENADSTPLGDGLSIPAEVQRRQERKAKLAEARAEIEARAQTRAALERADDERKLAARDATRATGKKPRGKEPRPPSDAPNPKDQVNSTDPESRIMPVRGGGFEQCDNAQAAVEVERWPARQRRPRAHRGERYRRPTQRLARPRRHEPRAARTPRGRSGEESRPRRA